MIRIAIVDDDTTDAETLENILKKYEKEHSNVNFYIKKFSTAIAFLDKYQPFDIVFMDIEMPTMTGMEACYKLREIDQTIAIIFVTNMAQFAVEGYIVRAFDFAVKPISYGNLALKLDRVIEYISHFTGKIIHIKTPEKTFQIALEEIIYIDIYNYILTYHTINDKIDVTTTSLLDIEKQLIKYGFFKINRSTIVNLKYIKSVKDTLVDVNGNILTLSRRRKKEFMEKLKARTGLEVVLWDERLSTVSAMDVLKEGGVRSEHRKTYVDKIAASLILQGYLDSIHN